VGLGIHVGDLTLGVHAGIGAGGAVDGDGMIDDLAGGDFNDALDGADGFGLALPAAEHGAVIGDGEFVAFHGKHKNWGRNGTQRYSGRLPRALTRAIRVCNLSLRMNLCSNSASTSSGKCGPAVTIRRWVKSTLA
jgi:hypothetical protein